MAMTLYRLYQPDDRVDLKPGMPKVRTETVTITHLLRPEVSKGSVIGHARCEDCLGPDLRGLSCMGVGEQVFVVLSNFSEGCQLAGSPRN